LRPKLIQELFVLRCIACLSITLLHALNRVYPETGSAMDFAKLVLTFGTPAFVFISEMILSYSYPEETPKSFWQKRVKYIFVPYLLFGVLYAFLKSAEEWLAAGTISIDVLLNYLWRHIVLGDYHGYFILIIFQFYLLHALFNRFIRNWTPLRVIGISLAINLAYLSIFNFTQTPGFYGANYIWTKMFWLPFAGWLFYFSLAYYCGKYYEHFKERLTKYGKWSFMAVAVTGTCSYLLLSNDVIPVISSKRVDMVLFTVSLIFFLCYIVSKVRDLHPVIMWVSKYSFGIYLLHPLFMAVMFIPLQAIPAIRSNWIGIAALFISSILASVFVTYLLNKTRWGPYLIGKIGIVSQKRSVPAVSASEKSLA
jgi:membrane-bound acyltransferase YfiQ involved in biofilm formation